MNRITAKQVRLRNSNPNAYYTLIKIYDRLSIAKKPLTMLIDIRETVDIMEVLTKEDGYKVHITKTLQTEHEIVISW